MNSNEKKNLIAGTVLVIATAIAGISYVAGKVVEAISKDNDPGNLADNKLTGK